MNPSDASSSCEWSNECNGGQEQQRVRVVMQHSIMSRVMSKRAMRGTVMMIIHSVNGQAPSSPRSSMSDKVTDNDTSSTPSSSNNNNRYASQGVNASESGTTNSDQESMCHTPVTRTHQPITSLHHHHQIDMIIVKNNNNDNKEEEEEEVLDTPPPLAIPHGEPSTKCA